MFLGRVFDRQMRAGAADDDHGDYDSRDQHKRDSRNEDPLDAFLLGGFPSGCAFRPAGSSAGKHASHTGRSCWLFAFGQHRRAAAVAESRAVNYLFSAFSAKHIYLLRS